jgi:AmmeMemoRadiSam system protein A
MLVAAQHQHLLLDAARLAIRQTLRGQCPPAPPPCPEPALLAPAGSFVSLHELGTHRLRGCVGRMEATQPLWHSVHGSAVGVLEDPRFFDLRVTLADLPRLEIEISVLSPMRDAASPTEFDLLSEGIYLSYGGRSGCFLPQVARETGWSHAQLLGRLCTEKMGLPPNTWREPGARLQVFSTQIIGPEPFGREVV